LTVPGEPLPDEITLSRHEAATLLFALDEAIERTGDGDLAQSALQQYERQHAATAR